MTVVNEELMEIVCCPVDKEALELTVTERDGEEIIEGELTCTECNAVYPIEDGIPNLLPPDMQEGTSA